jgi:regulator of protease activity HflC (stomatin/prohibitin superfamily)
MYLGIMPSYLWILVGAVIVIVLSGTRIANEYERAVVFRLGRYRMIKGPGLYWLLPLMIERQQVVDIRTVTVSVEEQETITKDSVAIKLSAVLWFRIVDPYKAVVLVEKYRAAVYQLALTSLRNIICQHGLDEVLKERDRINGTLRSIVDAATAPWGITIEIVEIKDIEIPESMQRAMAREAEAVREKRARLIKAEAEFEASEKLVSAARLMVDNPMALELRRMQMVGEIGAENNSTVVILMPSDMVMAARKFADKT